MNIKQAISEIECYLPSEHRLHASLREPVRVLLAYAKRRQMWIVYEDCCGLCFKGSFWTEAEARSFAKANACDLIQHVEEISMPVSPDMPPCTHDQGAWQFEGDLRCRRCGAFLPDPDLPNAQAEPRGE